MYPTSAKIACRNIDENITEKNKIQFCSTGFPRMQRQKKSVQSY